MEDQRARTEFADRHCVVLPGLVEADVLRSLQEGLDHGEFYERTNQEKLGTELTFKPDRTSVLLELLVNDDTFLRWIRQTTGYSEIQSFRGRVYRLIARSGHQYAWHDDVGRGRLVAMSINLSREAYKGGVLQIRDTTSERLVHRVANLGFGDAVIFRICPHLCHRVTAVRGATAKTAYAGWFLSEQEYRSAVRESIARSRSLLASCPSSES